MFKYLVCVILSLSCLAAHGDTINIKYHVPDAMQVTMDWGVNDWGVLPNMPPGTVIKDNIMHSPMKKTGDDYVLKAIVPNGTNIDCVFDFTRITGPFRVRVGYVDLNEQAGQKSYHIVVKGNMVVRINPDLNKLKPARGISLLRHSALFLFIFTTLALLLYLTKKFILKKHFSPLNPVVLFFAISVTLLIILAIIRALITNESVHFLVSPVQALPVLFKTSFQDFLYTAALTMFFGLLFFFIKRKRTLILWIFGSFAVLSIAICMANITITALLGRPFNCRWLYYSDFLISSDASRAIGHNIDKRSVLAYLIMILAAVPLCWLIYQLLIKRPVVAIFILISCLGLGYFAKVDLPVDSGKTENPVIYFLSSTLQQNGLAALTDKKDNEVNKFARKNDNIIQPGYASAFKKANIKNVIVFVLESTPAEYITPYNSAYNTTPFLDSIKSSSLYIDAAYAHVPATNKSLVSILCGNYPYLSYKSITNEKPDITWPSISSELKKYGYRTSFFNSGDNHFQHADLFLNHRAFNVIEDYRNNICNAPIFSDPRYKNENVEGINDGCLPVKFFSWLKNDQTTPFFSMMWTYQTHYPYYTTGKRIDFHSNNESKEKYLNALHDADNVLRQLVAGLKIRGMLNSTLIVVLGDHGEAFGRHNQTTHAGGIYEENLHIPLILINPELFKGEHIDEVAGISDVAPTVLSVLNKPVPEVWQGEDLFSIKRRDKAYFFSPFSDWLFGCRQGNYKLIYNATTNISHLYDLKADPYESVDIAGKNRKYTEELNKDLNIWMRYQVRYVNSFLK